MTTPPVLHGLTIDVEDWFHVLDCEGAPDPASWLRLPSRVERNTLVLLDLLDRHGVKATFFCLGWVAEHFPAVAAEIARRGHQLGSHSHGHGLVGTLGPDAFARDLDRSLEALHHATGTTVTCFRAPGFSITQREAAWALPIIADHGITLDSSLFLTHRAHGGLPLDRSGPFEIALADGRTLLEVPVVPRRVAGRELAFSGGGYLRLFPLQLLVSSFGDAERRGRGAIAYLHPREVDPDQPRMALPPWRRFKYYVGLKTVTRKLDSLLDRFRFGTLSAVAQQATLEKQATLAELTAA